MAEKKASDTQETVSPETKPKYTTPEMICLGEMARGIGVCFDGNSETSGGCSTGGLNNDAGTGCAPGTVAP